MEKKYIQKFLQEKKRGVYTLIVQMYAEVFQSMGVNMALEVIRDDLEKECGCKIELNYFSLAQAVVRYRKTAKPNTLSSQKKWEFKDAHELPDNKPAPGRFKLNK